MARTGQRRATRRGAAVAAGVLVLGAVWSGVAGAAPLAPPVGSPAPSAECEQARTALADAQTQLTTALEGLTELAGVGDLQTEVESLGQEVADLCTSASTLAGTTGAAAVPAPAAALVPGAAAAPGGDLDCPDFLSQPEAQAYFDSIGGSAARNADRLDRNRNGVACEDYPYVAAASAGTLPAGGFGQVSAIPSGGIETGGSTAP